MTAAKRNRLPRLLITGFEPFAGAPVNPTEFLVRALADDPLGFAGMSAFRAALLPVDYRAIGSMLSDLGGNFAPDIAIHFGLAAGCGGFRLERVARNRFEKARPDNLGVAPADGPICAAGPVLTPTLPLEPIHDALTAAHLPVEWSDDAGGYLCNMAMTLSLAGTCAGFSPAMSGFVHVPLTGERTRLSEAQLLKGAAVIAKAALRVWRTGYSSSLAVTDTPSVFGRSSGVDMPEAAI